MSETETPPCAPCDVCLEREAIYIFASCRHLSLCGQCRWEMLVQAKAVRTRKTEDACSRYSEEYINRGISCPRCRRVSRTYPEKKFPDGPRYVCWATCCKCLPVIPTLRVIWKGCAFTLASLWFRCSCSLSPIMRTPATFQTRAVREACWRRECVRECHAGSLRHSGDCVAAQETNCNKRGSTQYVRN